MWAMRCLTKVDTRVVQLPHKWNGSDTIRWHHWSKQYIIHVYGSFTLTWTKQVTSWTPMCGHVSIPLAHVALTVLVFLSCWGGEKEILRWRPHRASVESLFESVQADKSQENGLKMCEPNIMHYFAVTSIYNGHCCNYWMSSSAHAYVSAFLWVHIALRQSCSFVTV